MDTKKCSICSNYFPITLDYFYAKPGGKFGMETMCKTCSRKIKSTWAKNNREKNREKILQNSRNSHAKMKEHNRFYQRDYVKRVKLGVKKEVFDGYGHICACCGETTFEFLSLDHRNGGGNSDRKKYGKSSYRTINMYRDVIKMGFPDTFQILCFNCHFAKDFYGECPHGNVKREYQRFES